MSRDDQPPSAPTAHIRVATARARLIEVKGRASAGSPDARRAPDERRTADGPAAGAGKAGPGSMVSAPCSPCGTRTAPPDRSLAGAHRDSEGLDY